jgi:hypothetical protein
MNNFKLIILNIYIIITVSLISSCCKNSPNVIVPQTCNNPIVTNNKLKIGVWVQNPIVIPGLEKIEFVNDSILNIFSGSSIQKWNTNIHYSFENCNTIKFLKYWIIQLPNALDYEFYGIYYIDSTSELHILKNDENIPITQKPETLDLIYKRQ